MGTSLSTLVVLGNGATVSAGAVHLLWELLDRGVTIEPAGETGLAVGPSRRLTDRDRLAIRELCGELRMLVDQEGPEQ